MKTVSKVAGFFFGLWHTCAVCVGTLGLENVTPYTLSVYYEGMDGKVHNLIVKPLSKQVVPGGAKSSQMIRRFLNIKATSSEGAYELERYAGRMIFAGRKTPLFSNASKEASNKALAVAQQKLQKAPNITVYVRFLLDDSKKIIMIESVT